MRICVFKLKIKKQIVIPHAWRADRMWWEVRCPLRSVLATFGMMC